MANEYPTMLDLAKMNGIDMALPLIENNVKYAPELNIFPARTISGTSFKTLIQTALPGSQFRNANEGVFTTKALYTNKQVECFYLDQQMECDKALADADDQGADKLLQRLSNAHGKAAVIKIGTQIWYGQTANGDAKGFPGAISVVKSDYVLDAGGTTASTGSSVYGVKMGEENANIIFGKNTVLNSEGWRKQTITRDSKELTAWKNSLEGWVGMQWANEDCLCRLKDCTADAGKMATDHKLAELMSKLVWVPDFWFMTRRSRFHIQLGRTPVLSSGTSTQYTITSGMADLPQESNGIPIIISDCLLNTETLS